MKILLLTSLSLFLIIFFSLIFSFSSHAQNCEAFKRIKANSRDSVALGTAESNDRFSVFERVFLLRSNIDLDRKDKVKALLMSLAFDGFYIDDMVDVKSINSVYLSGIMVTDTIFGALYRSKVSKAKIAFEKDTVNQAIEKMYTIDQNARKLGKLMHDYDYICQIDSLNEKFVEGLLLGTRPVMLSYKAQDQLYILLLHICRRMDGQLFIQIDKRLLQLLGDKNFNPVSYAMIVDERLRVSNSEEYPKYNFLINEKVDEEKKRRIDDARCLINAF